MRSKWEYTVSELDKPPNAVMLNEMAKMGWEFMHTAAESYVFRPVNDVEVLETDKVFAYFRRERPLV